MAIDGPGDRASIVAQLAHDLQRAAWMTQVHDVRCKAVIHGVWDELSVQFPKHFSEAFELVGSSPAAVQSFGEVPPATPVSPERLQSLSGKHAFLRIRRADGRTEAVAGVLGEVSEREIKLPAFDVASAERLLQPGDALLFRKVANRFTHYGIEIDPGDAVITAIELPVEPMSAARTATQKRVSLRERAEATARGEYTPRVDLAHPERYLARHPETGAVQVHDFKPVFTVEFMTAVKVEQNVLATPLVHELTRRTIAIMQSDAFADKLADATTWNKLGELLDAHASRVALKEMLAELEAKPDSALGRAYANLERVADFNFTFIPTVLRDIVKARTLLRGGITTAVNAMRDLGAAASVFAKKNPELSVVELMRNSLPLVLRLASAHMTVFQAHLATLRGDDYGLAGIDQGLELVIRGDKPRLEPSAKTLETLAAKYGVRPDTVLHGTTGCPAGHSIGAGNPIHEFANAFMEMVARTPLVNP